MSARATVGATGRTAPTQSASRLASPALLRRELARVLPERPFELAFWDGSLLGATEHRAPRFTLSSPTAITRMLAAPNQLGLGRAYVAGDLEVSDLDAALTIVTGWTPPALDRHARARLLIAAAVASGPRLVPPAPATELRLDGTRHSRERDARAVRHHYDVSNEFFAQFLDASMTYSCAIFSHGARTLEEAQQAKLELVCQKLALRPGERVLDVGCGWGSFAMHAARHHNVHVVGITLSPEQARLARARADEAGLGDRVEIRVADYRDVAGERFDAVASIGMVEHVGEDRIDEYAQRLAALLEPGGRLLNHGIARLRRAGIKPGPFSERYVFPDGDPLPLPRVLSALEGAGFEIHHIEDFRADYAETLRHWTQRLEDNLDVARELAGDERTRVWRLYLRAARNGFESARTSIFQVRATRGSAGMR
jgi:cyclopropane-fatty-acyl-phospholipid synthase